MTSREEAFVAMQQRVAERLEELSRQIDSLTTHMATLETDVRALRELLADTSAKLAANERSLSELSEQIDAIHQSRSWHLSTIRSVAHQLLQTRIYFGYRIQADPLAGLTIITSHDRFTEWMMNDDDPQFSLNWSKRHPLPPGHYRLSLEMSPSEGRLVHPTLYVDSGEGFHEGQHITLQLQVAGKAKSITRIGLPHGALRLRLDPSVKPGRLSLGRIRIRRIGRLERWSWLVAGLFRQYIKKMILRVSLLSGSSEGVTTARHVQKQASLERPRPTIEPPGIDPGSEHAAMLQVKDVHVAQAWIAVEGVNVGRFSIVMPTWNRRQNIGKAIESVLVQSYENWELIICDDGSTDGTEEYIRERFNPYLRSGQIRILSLSHGGVSAARNAGLRAARGSWIAYLDSDNTWHAHYLLLTAASYATSQHSRTAYSCVHVHDEAHQREFIRCQPFDWHRLLSRNFIDLNVFSHHQSLLDQLGGFDETLTRLVDWDLILRYTQIYEPQYNPFVLCDYYVSHQLNNITLRESLEQNEATVRRKFAVMHARHGPASLRLAYVLWDWPALSQTFVLEELRELRRRNIDVRVYYAVRPDRAAQNLPDVIAQRVTDSEELARFLVEDNRNWIHSHFAYPAVTELVWPAAEKAGVAFSFMPHAVDIFHKANRQRNRIGEIAKSPLCARVMVYGDHHRRFLVEHGVPAEKIIMTPQAIDTEPIRNEWVKTRTRRNGESLRVLTIGRFIEKKGIEHMIEAAMLLDRGSVEMDIYGYGPLEGLYRETIERHGLHATVRLRGVFEGADALRDVMTWADVFCLPCIEAEDGDLDGMPTVLFEAMASGVPCIAGAISAIPDFITDGITGFLVPPGDTQALAAALRRVADLPADVLSAIAQAAWDWTADHLGTPHTIDTLLDTCANPPLDIFMVTYHREGRGDWSATERAIRSVIERTTTPFVLTIVDNGSEEGFLDRLRTLARGDHRIRLLELGENLKCGPASNVALSLARSEFVFYVCSNEGYVARPGWERPCLRYMRNRPHLALGGHLVFSPSWPDGRGYTCQDWFADFRNPEFARQYPDREFFHVQGGLWVLRREVFEKEGGFSEQCPQAQTDVEYSYFLESRGYSLGDIPGLMVVSNKTRPGLGAFLDETVLAAHPAFEDITGHIDIHADRDLSRCNICDWSGRTHRTTDGVSFDCPSCGSTPRDRAAFRWLAASNLHHRGLSLDARDLGQAACAELQTMFRLVRNSAQVKLPNRIPGTPSRMLGLPPQSLTSTGTIG